jgi:hypothetical protein
MICRAFQLYHADPLPTIAGFLFANLYVEERLEDDDYSLENLINYVYEHVDMITGRLIIENLKPVDMPRVAYLLYHL